jgi:phosphoribosylamine--glycine ligase
MNVAVIGSGGREHALTYKISQSPKCEKIFIIPGNPGTCSIGQNAVIDIKDHNAITNFCQTRGIDLVVIGPEIPLVDGLADALREKGISVFGPNKNAAEIEASKLFAKNLMKEYNIPTADFARFNSNEYEKAKKYLESSKFPIVIKADGLAAGKGVLLCENIEQALASLDNLFIDKIFGESGDRIVIEEFLEGEEASIFAITDGEVFVCLPSAQDHKRIGDNDTGKNTGGMGAYSPAPIVTEEILKTVKSGIIVPTLKALRDKQKKFNGCLYCGLMITKAGPKVIEYNCRFGDPETQAVLPLLDGDFLELLYSAAKGKLNSDTVNYSGGSAVCVVAASKGYPDKYEKGFEITGLNNLNENDIIVFHAGTKESNGKIVTNGGRVLSVTSVLNKPDLRRAKELAYNAISKINFEGIYYRKDISDKAILNH